MSLTIVLLLLFLPSFLGCKNCTEASNQLSSDIRDCFICFYYSVL